MIPDHAHNPFRPAVTIHVVVVLALATIAPAAAAETSNAQKPNIVIIVADDLGWRDVSFHGGDIQTPNIDRLAAEGVELNRFYVCPVCSPTRAGLMTGRYPIRFGLMRAVVPPWRRGGLDLAEVTLPQVLAKAGYRHRGVFGKWHLGHSAAEYHPLRRGFSRFVGHYNGAIDYFTHEREGEIDWHDNYEPSQAEGYSTDLIADAAAAFIDRHAGDAAPFFCYVPFNAPHRPLQAKPGDLRRQAHLTQTGPAFAEPGGDDTGQNATRRYGQRGRGQSRRQTLAAMIDSMDQGIGRILAALERNQISDNTLVWFFSDNGGVGTGDNRPLRGAKTTVFEGGIRVAAALRWPRRIRPRPPVSTPLAYIDVLPTLMRIVGVEDHGGKPLDGIDALDVITGTKTAPPRDLYSYIGQGGERAERIALIEPQWKLVVNGAKITAAAEAEREILLFRIDVDPNETQNVARKNPQVVERMTTKLKTFRALQPAGGVPPYGQGREGFKAPRHWKIPSR